VAFFFHEFHLGPLRGLLFGFGLIIVCVGIFCLSTPQSNTPPTTTTGTDCHSENPTQDCKTFDPYESEQAEGVTRRSLPQNTASGLEVSSWNNSKYDSSESNRSGSILTIGKQPTETSPLLEHPP